MVLGEQRLLHLDLKAARKRLSFHTGQSRSIGDLKAQSHSDTLPQQGHAHFHKATPTNNATPCGPSFQTHESMGVTYSVYHTGIEGLCHHSSFS